MTLPDSTKPRLFFAIDFDGTIVQHAFPDVGRLRPDMLNLMRWLRQEGHCIILWTCREGKYLDDAVKFLDKAGIPYDYVNENPEAPYVTDSGIVNRKVYAHYYIDDRAVELHSVKQLFANLRIAKKRRSSR